ncbi:hypothetical protein SAMN05660662_2196 [Blastococcus aurantiacus]|uniref:Uncharacterized protein n=1 Tax=Blastococcus aurantiacus TaxID=1550231 RepID=A0A1G7L0R9_9ACTN|nr:hypothetical protein [Blastococcus aurantiacus]SDF43132.1 hypothetical protein SAMN05660662_2196 [Blastococcus aurantiacus]
MAVSGTDAHPRQAWDAAVGRLLAEAAAAEARMSSLLRILAGVDGPAASAVLPREVPAMVGVVEDLLPVHIRDRRLLDDFRRWVHAVGRLCALRATVVHAVWELRPEDGGAVMHPAWSRADTGRHPMTPAELSRTTNAVARLLGPPSDDLLLRLDKAVPELGVFSHR